MAAHTKIDYGRQTVERQLKAAKKKQQQAKNRNASNLPQNRFYGAKDFTLTRLH